ncbi:TadE family protein [Actinocrispum wychmicini]|uniref:TadE-like protein n=1 Tax=Actinocrispum wychmicini TaxID=1213861 RepID=A0A4R2J2W6_9PSEU|nr:TadE family protein [Actinocrispum wychmicini]TCO49645.1 TadE-like protein [Actinocrispum wychmicini]
MAVLAVNRRQPGDRGSLTVEWALWALPVVIVVLGLLQFGLWWVARDLAMTSAQQGLLAGRGLGATPADARAAATRFIARADPIARDPDVSTAGTTDQVLHVDVSVSVLTIIPDPWLTWRVHQSVAGARERFTVPGNTR